MKIFLYVWVIVMFVFSFVYLFRLSKTNYFKELKVNSKAPEAYKEDLGAKETAEKFKAKGPFQSLFGLFKRSK